MRIELSPWQSTETTIRVVASSTAIAAAAATLSSNPKNRRRKRENSPTPTSNGDIADAYATDDADAIAEDCVLGSIATSFVHLTSKGNVRRARQKKQAAGAAAAAAVGSYAYAPEDLTHPPCLVITGENCITVVGRHEKDASLKESTCRKYNCRPGTHFLPSNNVNQLSLPLISAVLDEKHERLYAFQRENQRLVSWSTLDDDSQKDDLILKHSFDEPATSLDLVELSTVSAATATVSSSSTSTTAARQQQQQQTRVFCYGSLQDSKKLFVGTSTMTTTNAATGKEEHNALEVQTFDIPSKENQHDDLRIVGTVAQPAMVLLPTAATAGTKRKSTVMTSSSSSSNSGSSCYFYQVLMARDRILLVRHTISAAAFASTRTADQTSSNSTSKSNKSSTSATNSATTVTTNHAMERIHVQSATIILPPSMQQQYVMAETAQFVGLVPSDHGSGGGCGTVILTFQTATADLQRQQQAEQSHQVYMISISLRTAEIVAGPFAISCRIKSGSRNEACLLMGASGHASQQAIIVAVPSPLDNEIFLYDAMRGALIQRIEIPNDAMHGQDKANRWSLAVDSKRSLLAMLHEQNGKVYLSIKSLMATSRTPRVLSLADGLSTATSSSSYSTTRSLTTIPTTNALAVGDLTTVLEYEENVDDGGGSKRKKMKLISTSGQRALIVQSLLMLRKAHDEIRDAATKTAAIARLKAGYLRDAFEAAITMASPAAADEDSSSNSNNNESINPSINEQENEQNQDIIVVSANPQDDRSPWHDSTSLKLKSSPGNLINGLKSHNTQNAVNGHRTPTLVPTHETPAPSAAAATTTTTTAANPNATSGTKRRNSNKTLNSLPTGFVDGAVALIIQILMLPPGGDDSNDRKAIHDEARLILGRLLKTRKTSARALFHACSKSNDNKKSLQKFLQSLENRKGEDDHACYSAMDFSLDLLQFCVDVSERHMMLLIDYMLTASRPEDVAACFLRNKTRSDIVNNASYISSIAMSDRFIKLQEKLKDKKEDSSGQVGGNDTQNEKNDGDAKDAQEMDILSSKLILAGTDTLLDAILSYSDYNETLIRGALTEFIPRSGRLVLAKMLWEKRSQPRKMTPAGNSLHVTKSNRLVVLLSALCDTLQHGQSCSASELTFFKSIQTELDQEVHGADALLQLQQTLNEAEMRMQQSSSVVGADTSGPTKQQLHPYQLERLVF